jgi:8-oxo-dGTP diphosphatase
MTDSTYNYQTLPKKRMAAGALFLNEKGNILIVKPAYRPEWLLPGGCIELYESPREACIREVLEELHLEVSLEKLLCVEYLSEEHEQTECIQFSFYGGVLSQKQIDDIILPSEELREYIFAPLEQAVCLLSLKLAKRVPYCIQALSENATIYLEDGRRMC